MKVIVDLHAAPGSQNGWEHSSSRDGSQEWGLTDANIQQTVDVIDFLTARFSFLPNSIVLLLLLLKKKNSLHLIIDNAHVQLLELSQIENVMIKIYKTHSIT